MPRRGSVDGDDEEITEISTTRSLNTRKRKVNGTIELSVPMFDESLIQSILAFPPTTKLRLNFSPESATSLSELTIALGKPQILSPPPPTPIAAWTAFTVERPLQVIHSTVRVLACVDRWVETMQELGTFPMSEPHRDNFHWKVFIRPATHSPQSASDNVLTDVAKHIGAEIKRGLPQRHIEIKSSTFRLEGEMDWEDVQRYLRYSAERVVCGNSSQAYVQQPHHSDESSIVGIGSSKRKRGQSVLPDRSSDSVTRNDIEHIKSLVNSILHKLVNIWIWGIFAVHFMREARLEEDKIREILRGQSLEAVVQDLYDRREIEYSWHWLRNWYPLFFVEQSDPNWARSTLFNENGVFRCERGKAAEEVRKLYATRYKELVERKEWRGVAWSELMKTKIYYVPVATAPVPPIVYPEQN